MPYLFHTLVYYKFQKDIKLTCDMEPTHVASVNQGLHLTSKKGFIQGGSLKNVTSDQSKYTMDNTNPTIARAHEGNKPRFS